jgi:signal transduction histidine kinase/ligand-binding sensor domain-containing protein
MRKLACFLLLLIPVLSGNPAIAQLNPNNLVHYSDLDGTIILDVMADRQANIWLASQNGLVKYNGYEFQRFYQDPNDSTAINTILTGALYEDPKGNIWIGCTDGINVYHPATKTFSHYQYNQLTDFPEGGQATVTTILPNGSGRIYFGITSTYGFEASHALVYFDEKEKTIKRFEYPDNLKLFNVFDGTADKNGNLWLLTFGGFYKIDQAGTLSKLDEPSKSEFPGYQGFSAITADSDGTIWIASNQRTVYSLDPRTGKYSSYPLSTLVDPGKGNLDMNRMVIDATGNIWIASSQGLIRFDRQNAKFEMFGQGPEMKLQRAAINSLSIDQFGNLWAGTASNGLLKYNDQTVFKSFISNRDDKSAFLPGWATSLTQSPDGHIWLITQGSGADHAGIVDFDPVSQTIATRTYHGISPKLDAIYNWVATGPGEFLINSNLGYCQYFPKTNTIKRNVLPWLPDSVGVFKFFSDSRGNFWVLSPSGIYIQDKEQGKYQRYALTALLGNSGRSNEITDAFESKKHGLWLLGNDGLYLYDYQTDKITRHGIDKSRGDVFVSHDINSFYEDSSGIAWVGTWQGGLSRYNVETGEIKTFTTANGLPSMCIQGILADEKNNDLWLSTFNGLSRFNMVTGQFTNFSLEDGIQSLLFADGGYMKTKSGLFVFSGSNGITVFNPDQIAKNAKPPKLFVTDLKVADQSVSFDKNLELSYDQNNLIFEYLAIHYANPAKNIYSYKLENYDTDWRNVGNQRTAVYYNLPPGEYTFRVKAASSNGVWNEEGATVKLHISPPWWRTWLAYLMYSLVAMALIYLLDRVQRKRVTDRERARAKEKELADAKEIEKAYHTLKTTQAQLVHAEKMASLGQLTAGIAHEIQNPLNFINNFSEVNSELIEEMKTELKDGNLEDARALADDISINEQKISQHGKRADAIVKGMLQHSRTSSGVKEPANINSLADEFLRLAYHGLQAKDKSFNATMKTDFDPGIGKIDIIPQDMGRVILNLLTNAFYAVNEKSLEGIAGYEPTVTVSTKKSGDFAEIRVGDNGNGIPQKVLDKIFQPFFTTKPAGEGTGLGLSMAYDTITLGHNGDLKVETTEGEGTVFIVILPTT